MCKAVSLAARARNNRRTLPSALRHPCVALSLGPYGATLTPTQEFGGYYPPPYGPRVFSSSFANTNTFENVSDERISEDSLCEFHLRRLRVFAENASIWSEIDCIAFETVPLLREARAIRKAMARLRDDGFELKPWWISFVFPDGQLPDEKLTDTNGRLRPSDVVIDMFTSGDNDIPIPTAIGINCTSPQYLNALLEDMSASMKEVSKSLDLRPWLIIYPNGGKIYDIHSQSWSQPASAGDRPRWAEAVVESVRRHVGDEAWGGVVIGGCCKTRPEDIRQLAARRLDL
jgi:homocysteine S-methyltransferase